MKSMLFVLFLLLLSSGTMVFAQTPEQITVKDPTGNQSYQVNYSVNGATIQDITVNQDDTSLIVDVKTSADSGSLTITMPRALIDAKSGSADDQFIVLEDGADTDFNETQTNSNDRTISVEFPAGTEQIEIIGTHVVPEFGEISIAILALAILSIIVFSTKNKLRFAKI